MTGLISSSEGASDVFDGLLNDVPLTKDLTNDPLVFDFSTKQEKDLFAIEKRRSWQKDIEARCDFERHVTFTRRSDLWFAAIWRKSPVGMTLTEIKSDPDMIPRFTDNIAELLIQIFGDHLNNGTWAICTTPKRRHKERNFATLISIEISQKLSLPFYEDAALCRNRSRIGAIFDPNNIPKEPNIICFDDFVTTGQTLRGMANLLQQYNKTVFYITGINNA